MSSLTNLRGLGGRALRRLGLDPIRTGSLRHPLERRKRLLHALAVDLVIDVGANNGEYGNELRRMGYRGRIVSFEPLAGPFQELSRRAALDGTWSAVHSAIGPSPGHASLHVAANRGASSSFLPMLEELERDAPEARYTGMEEVSIQRLDDACAGAIKEANAPFLKADVQGYELQVLESATGIMAWIVGLQLEMSLVPLYSGAPSLRAVLDRAEALGFALVGLEPGFTAADGRLLQADGLFERPGLRGRR